MLQAATLPEFCVDPSKCSIFLLQSPNRNFSYEHVVFALDHSASLFNVKKIFTKSQQMSTRAETLFLFHSGGGFLFLYARASKTHFRREIFS